MTIMPKITFLKVLKSNIKCAICKKRKCPVRYFPERKSVQVYDGHRFVTTCEKDDKKYHKDMEQMLNKPMH